MTGPKANTIWMWYNPSHKRKQNPRPQDIEQMGDRRLDICLREMLLFQVRYFITSTLKTNISLHYTVLWPQLVSVFHTCIINISKPFIPIFRIIHEGPNWVQIWYLFLDLLSFLPQNAHRNNGSQIETCAIRCSYVITLVLSRSKLLYQKNILNFERA